ncbi:MAG: winged helix-turn-helix transcriptional regulator [Desulfurellales bacterium]|nr:MAG: winged helix-turn-helix transcriptional regulator [Desulfurellales bacterium]
MRMRPIPTTRDEIEKDNTDLRILRTTRDNPQMSQIEIAVECGVDTRRVQDVLRNDAAAFPDDPVRAYRVRPKRGRA